MPNRQTTTSPLEACRTPAASLSLQSSLIDPVQRTWDAAGYANRTIFLHAFGFPCGLAVNTWDELHYTVRIVLRSYFQRLIKCWQVPAC